MSIFKLGCDKSGNPLSFFGVVFDPQTYKVSLARRTKIIGALVEGNSIRSVERMTETHRDNIMRLIVEVGTRCAKLHDETMRNLTCQRIQCDEIWAYIGKKQTQVTRDHNRDRVGDQWTFVAVDPYTMLVPAFLVGKRNLPTATAFIANLNDRLDNCVQLSTDCLAAYVDVVETVFGADVDYGQAVKFYDAESAGAGRYSPPKVVRSERTAVVGGRSEAHFNQHH